MGMTRTFFVTTHMCDLPIGEWMGNNVTHAHDKGQYRIR